MHKTILVASWLLAFVLVAALSGPALADEARRAAFKTRLEAAFAETDESARRAAFNALIFKSGLDAETTRLHQRSLDRFVSTDRNEVAFAALPADADFEHIVDGYAYRPNLDPVGYVVLTSPDDLPGNSTRIPYGVHPDTGAYAFPSTVRTLVNPNAAPDKQIQMIAIGMAHPPLEFEGWCDILLSDDTTRRVILDDQGVGNQTRILRGQAIQGCELTNMSASGTLGLKLIINGETIFDARAESPQSTLSFRP